MRFAPPMLLDPHDHVVVVTGGSRGIGAATARLLGASGHAVVVNYRSDEQAALEVVKAIEDAGGRALAVRADVSCQPEVLHLFETASAFGRVTGLVNNAGVVDQAIRVEAISEQRLQRLFSINVFGSFLCAREAVLRMSTARGGPGGAIVNVSSAASRHGAAGEYVDYAATKAAVEAMTVGLAKEVAGEGIRVNAVRPGIIDTEIHASGGRPDRAQRLAPQLPMQRPGSAEEVARAIHWLLSDNASYCTAAILDVAGGR